jgi:hypothetical protein
VLGLRFLLLCGLLCRLGFTLRSLIRFFGFLKAARSRDRLEASSWGTSLPSSFSLEACPGLYPVRLSAKLLLLSQGLHHGFFLRLPFGDSLNKRSNCCQVTFFLDDLVQCLLFTPHAVPLQPHSVICHSFVSVVRHASFTFVPFLPIRRVPFILTLAPMICWYLPLNLDRL